MSNQAIIPFKRLGWRSDQHCEFYGFRDFTKTILTDVATIHTLSDRSPIWVGPSLYAHFGEEALTM